MLLPSVFILEALTCFSIQVMIIQNNIISYQE